VFKGLALGAAALVTTAHVAGQQPVGLVSLDAPVYRNVGGVDVLPAQGQVYMLAGLSRNITVQVGPEGVMLVDTGGPGETERVMDAVAALTSRPVRYIVNTHADADVVAGNGAIVEANGGTRGPRPRQVGGTQGNQNAGVQVLSHESALLSMIQGRGLPAMSGDALPASVFFGAKKEFFANGEPVQLFHVPAGHTDGDVMVFFRGSDVISTGDVYNTTRYPEIDLARGGSIQGILDALNLVVDLAIPERNQMGGTRVIPGDGRLSNESDVVEYRDMATIIRDRVQVMVANGSSLADIQASNVSLEYDGLYGTDAEWTREMFLEAVYRGVGGR
jgi:glyoxylase-like metal-dependent hydrolase (beta-lactamase superfamily II)